jgi:HSP20 family protein
MSTLQQIRQDVTHAWDRVVDGWGQLFRRATGALTRFTPGTHKGSAEDRSSHREVANRGSGWGLLAAEVFDDDDRVVVRIEAPGLDKSDFDLQVVDDYLVVRGEKRVASERNEGRYHIQECAFGRFERAIALPDEVDTGKATAEYKNGVLRVELPKSHMSRRTIRVNVS